MLLEIIHHDMPRIKNDISKMLIGKGRWKRKMEDKVLCKVSEVGR